MPTSPNLNFPFWSYRSSPYDENVNCSLLIHLFLLWIPVMNLLPNGVTNYLNWVCCQFAFMDLDSYLLYFSPVLFPWTSHWYRLLPMTSWNIKREFVLCKYTTKFDKGQSGYNLFSELIKLIYHQCMITYITLNRHAVDKNSRVFGCFFLLVGCLLACLLFFFFLMMFSCMLLGTQYKCWVW